MGKQWEQCQTLFFWAPKSLQMVTVATLNVFCLWPVKFLLEKLAESFMELPCIK